MIALTRAQHGEYVLESDKSLPKDQQTVWLFRPLPFALRGEISLRAFKSQRADGNIELDDATQIELNMRALRFCLVGVRNFRDEAGAEVQFESTRDRLVGETFEVPTSEFLDRIPYDARVELGNAAMRSQFLTKDQVLG